MTILAGDIKLVESQVMLDTPEGGGAPTAHVIEDAVSNSIFPDISELDRAGGRVNLRKVHATVQTANTDGYYGANMIVAEPPQDPNVSITLFTTDSTFDRRADAKARLESYLAPGAPYQGVLFGSHLTGQRTVSLLAGQDAVIPVVGASLVLVKMEGAASEVSQFVRVSSVAAVNRTFEDDKGTFVRQEITLGISDPLRYDFPGFDAWRFFPSEANLLAKTRVRNAIVANAAKYAGVSPITSAAAIGDYSVATESIFTQLVPSAQVETPIADARINQQSAALVAAGASLTLSPTQVFDTSHAMYVSGGILPGSLNVVRGGITLRDQGGALVNASTLAEVGAVDYANGILTLSTAVWGSTGGTHTVSFTPASTPTVVSKSYGIPVTAASQRLTWVITLAAVPAKKSLQVSYRAQGRWYSLTEDGSGAIRGADSSFGVGSINFSTGTISVTLGALPDVGSQILFAWSPAVVAPKLSAIPTVSTFAALQGKLYARIELGAAIKPGTLSLSWNTGSGKYASDSFGALTGDASGVVDYSAGTIYFCPNVLPPAGTAVAITTTQATAATQTLTSGFTDGGASWLFSVPAPVRPGSFKANLTASRPASIVNDRVSANLVSVDITIYDDGAGNVLLPLSGVSSAGTTTIGTINYATGAVSIAKTVNSVPTVLPKYFRYAPGVYTDLR